MAHAVGTGQAGKILICLLVWGSTQKALSTDDTHIQIAVRDNQIQIGTDEARPFYMQWRSPTGDWVNWTESTIPPANEFCVWMRIIFEPDDVMQWEVPSDVNSVYFPFVQTTANDTEGAWVSIGGISAGGTINMIKAEDPFTAVLGNAPSIPLPDTFSDSPRNNQAMATPCQGTSQLIWRNPTSGIVSRWDLADTTGTNFVIRYYDRIRILPSMDAVSIDSTWSLACIAAIDSDGVKNDMVWHQDSSGRFALWRVNDDPTVGAYGPIQYEATPGVWTNVVLQSPWKVIGVASLDSDGLLNDIIWQQPSSGIISRWELGSDGKIARYGRMKYESSPGTWTDIMLASPWTLGAIAQLEADGQYNDFIWHNPTSGAFSYWKVDTNAYITSYGKIKYESAPDNWVDANLKSPWSLAGLCEVDNDDKVNDIIWHNPQSGAVSRWDVGTNGYVETYGRVKYQVGESWVDISLTSPWSLRGVAALNGDQKLNDLVWHHPTAGRFSCWRLVVSGEEVHISDYASFLLNGQNVTLASPWEITEVRGY